jgi:hypothetical protein
MPIQEDGILGNHLCEGLESWKETGSSGNFTDLQNEEHVSPKLSNIFYYFTSLK